MFVTALPERLWIAIAAVLTATGVLFAFGAIWNIFDARRRREELARRDPYWGSFTHAYGEASDLPRLLARMTPERGNPIWGELYERLCHQGYAATTAGVAAVPLLIEYAASLPPAQRQEPLALAGAIIADADRVLVPEEVRERYRAAVSRTPQLTIAAIEHMTDTAEFASLVGTLAAAEGQPILAHQLLSFLADELQMECPHCDMYLTIATESPDWVVAEGGTQWRIGEPSEDPHNPLRKYRDLAASLGQTRYAEWIDRLHREMRCPGCGESYRIREALE